MLEIIFNLSAISNKTNQILVRYKGTTEEFFMGKLSNKVNRGILLNPLQFEITNKYLNSRKDTDIIFKAYQDMKELIYNIPTKVELIIALSRFMDIFDIEEIRQFIKESGAIPPSVIKSEFDTNRERDALVTRDQTYTSEEYYGLAAIVVLMKILSPLISHMMQLNGHLFSNTNLTLSILSLFDKHKLFLSKPFDRMRRFIAKHIEHKATEAEQAIAAVKKDISVEMLNDLVLANAVFKKLIITPLEYTPAPNGHIVSTVFKLVDGVVSGRHSIADNISLKPATRGNEEDDEGSIVEAYTQISDQSIGNIAEMNLAHSTYINNFKLLGGKDIVLLDRLKESLSLLKHEVYIPNRGAVLLTSIVLSPLISARTIDYIEIDALISSMAVASTLLIEKGFVELGKLICISETKAEIHGIENPIDPYKVPIKVRTELEDRYISRVTKNRKKEREQKSIISGPIEELENMFYTGNYFYLLPSDMYEHKAVTLPNNLKEQLTLALINIKGN